MIYSLTQDGFTKVSDVVEQSQRTLTTELIQDDSALQKQDNSLDEYLDTHVQESLTPEIRYLSTCFRMFINFHLPIHPVDACTSSPAAKSYPLQSIDAKLTLLDVGCGISKRTPLYIRDIASQDRAVYVGLDPFEVSKERDYIFINGTFEGLHKFLQHKFDCLIFSTSLDHFPDLEAVNQEIHRVLKPNGIAIFWVGVHDPSIVAEQSICDSFVRPPILSISKVLQRIAKFPLLMIRTHVAMKRRNNKLSSRIPLDDLHFHYFTESSLKDFMETVGTVVECHHVKNTNSFFYAVRING